MPKKKKKLKKENNERITSLNLNYVKFVYYVGIENYVV